MDNRNAFQDFVITIICNYLNYCKNNNVSEQLFKSYGAKYAIKNGFISHYASIYQLQGEEQFVNIWQKIYYYANSNEKNFIKNNLLMSEKANSLLEKICVDISNKKVCSYSDYRKHNEIKEDKSQQLYWEHITPNSAVFDRICNLYMEHKDDSQKFCIDDVKKCFKNHKLVLLTKAEAEFLDKKFRSSGNAEKRIEYLYSLKDFVLHINGKRVNKQSALNENGFIGEIKKYFEQGNFIVD